MVLRVGVFFLLTLCRVKLTFKFAVQFRAALTWALRPQEEVSIKLHALDSKQIVGVSSFPILLVKTPIKFEYTYMNKSDFEINNK